MECPYCGSRDVEVKESFGMVCVRSGKGKGCHQVSLPHRYCNACGKVSSIDDEDKP